MHQFCILCLYLFRYRKMLGGYITVDIIVLESFYDRVEGLLELEEMQTADDKKFIGEIQTYKKQLINEVVHQKS